MKKNKLGSYIFARKEDVINIEKQESYIFIDGEKYLIKHCGNIIWDTKNDSCTLIGFVFEKDE